MLDVILIVLMVKIRTNYKEAGESGASRHILPAIACIVVAILLLVAGRSDDNLALMGIALLCYIPAFIIVLHGLKKSKELLAERVAAGVPVAPFVPERAVGAAADDTLPAELRELVDAAPPSSGYRVIRMHFCPNCGGGLEQIRPLGAKGSRGTGAAVTIAFGAVGNLVAQRAAANQLVSVPIEYKCNACKEKFLVYAEQANPSEVLEQPAVIVLTRRSGILGAAVARFILLNGEKVGTVKNNRDASFQTNVRHNELLMLDQYDATGDVSPLRFDVAPGEIIRILWNGKASKIVSRMAGRPAADADPFSTVSEEILFQSSPVQSFAAPVPMGIPAEATEDDFTTTSYRAEEPASIRREADFSAEAPEDDFTATDFRTEEPTDAAKTTDFVAENRADVPEAESARQETAAPEPARREDVRQTAESGAPINPVLPKHGFCNQCGTPLKGDAKFCHVCGALVKRGVRPNA